MSQTDTTGQGLPAPLAPARGGAPAKKSATLPETTEAYPWVSSQEIKKESNPFTDRDWRMLAYAWFGMGVRIIIVLGAIFTVYQFLAAREETRVQRTLDLVEVWEKEEYQQAQSALKNRINLLNEKNLAMLGNQPSQFEREVYFKQIGMKALSAEGGSMPLGQFSEQFDRIVYFLNRVAFCVESNLCSQHVADAFFRDYAESFWRYFSGYVAAQRKGGNANFATQIEKYVMLGQAAGSNLPPPAAQ